MTTVAKLVGRSLRLIQVIDPTQPVKAADMETAIEALNSMMERWEADGLALGWQPVANPSDTVPIPKEAEDGVTYNLSVRLAPEYGVDIHPAVGGSALSFLNDLLRDQMVATPIRPILDVPIPAANGEATRLRSTAWDY